MYSTYYDLNYCGLLSVALAKDSEARQNRTAIRSLEEIYSIR